MKSPLVSALCGLALCLGSAQAEIVITLRPPIGIHERRPMRPSRQHVWIGGYHRWDGSAYSWQGGRWEQPPRPYAVWVAPRYIHRRDGYIYVEGHWR
jgi:hypothetical protein